MNVTSKVGAWQVAGNNGLFGIWGPEGAGYSYKAIGAAMVVVTSAATPATTPVGPADGYSFWAKRASAAPTLSVNAVTDSDASGPVKYWFEVSSGSSVQWGQGVANSGWQSSTSWTPPASALDDGRVYRWKVWTWDSTGWNVVQPAWERSFRYVRRLGLGQPSPYDQLGPVSVNLATGNVVFSWSDDIFTAVGGTAKVSLTYNSAAVNTPMVAGLPNGWSGSWTDDGAVALSVGTGSVLVRFGDGSTETFTASGGGWKADEWVHDSLTKNLDGSWLFAEDDGTVGRFDAAGNLTDRTAVVDDRHPASMRWTYATVNGATRATKLRDPVTGRELRLTYWGPGQTCPTIPSGLYSADGLVCKVEAFSSSGSLISNTTTGFFYSSGTNPQLKRIAAPGSETTDLSFDASGRLTQVRDPLVSDLVGAGSTLDATAHTTVTYDSATGAVTKLEAPKAAGATNRVTHTYSYSGGNPDHGAGSAKVNIAGASEPNGYSRQVFWDDQGRTTDDVDALGRHRSYTNWRTIGPSGQLLMVDVPNWVEESSTDQLGAAMFLRTGTEYNSDGSVFRQWGPMPRSTFSGTDISNGYAWSNSADAPMTQTNYDEGLSGVATTVWPSSDLSGAATLHLTDSDASRNWGSGAPAGLTKTDGTAFTGGDNWSQRSTGRLTFPVAGTYTLKLFSDGKSRMFVDGALVVDNSNVTDGTTTSASGAYTAPSAGHKAKVVIEYLEGTGAAFVETHWIPPAGGGSAGVIPASSYAPDYGLVTSTISRTKNVGGTPQTVTTRTGYGTIPETGLVHTVTEDYGGLNLTTTTGYETKGASGSYLRRTSRQLPSGSTSQITSSYYTATETPIASVCGAGSTQHGLLKQTVAATPGGGEAPLVRQFVYDAVGRQVGFRVGRQSGTGAVSSAPWTCTTFDNRGRTQQVVHPAYGGDPGRTVNYGYTANSNGTYTTTVNDNSIGVVTTITDLLGRTISYTDVWNKTTTTAYDAVGRVSSTTGPAGTLAYTYKADHQVDTVSLNSKTIATTTYNNSGQLTNVAHPAPSGTTAGNGTSAEFFYDAAARDVAVRWSKAGVVLSAHGTTRRIDGKVINDSLVDVNGGANHDAFPGENFSYDNAGRLTSAKILARGGGGTFGAVIYDYNYTTTPSCPISTVSHKNSNRTSKTYTNASGVPTTTTYCYDYADRLTSTTEPAIGTLAYDEHGNTTTIGGETRSYDSADRHRQTTKGATTVAYTRDGLDRIVERKLNGTTVAKYSYGATGDSPAVTLNAAGTPIEATISLPGGTLYTHNLTTPANSVWSHPNMFGSVLTVTDANGNKVGNNFIWEPDGNPAPGSTIPDNTTGSWDYGWHGQAQRPLEHQAGLLPTIEMGARQYDPTLGRFLEVDPIEGGLDTNDYAYVRDPIDSDDLNGQGGPRDPHLNRAEGQAVANKKAGKPYDRKAYNSAQRKIRATEKYAGERNRQKRQSEQRGKGTNKSVDAGRTAAAGGAIAGAAGLAWWAGKLLSPACGPAAPVCLVVL